VARGFPKGRRGVAVAINMAEWLYGRHAVLEALRAGRREVRRVYVAPGVRKTAGVDEIVAAAQARRCPVEAASPGMLQQAGPANHQGILAEAAGYPYVALGDVLPPAAAGEALYLVLDHLQDVQNLATLLRTAEAMAVAGVLLPDRRSAQVTPAVVNASAGAVEHLRIALVGNLVAGLEALKQAGVWIVGLDLRPGSVTLDQADLSGPLALVVGSEGSGLSRLVRQHCDWLLTIPMYGRVGSLNAAVAGSVALVTARRARSAGSPSRAGAILPPI